MSPARTVRLAISVGDPAGIGPEIVAQCLASLPAEVGEVRVYGDASAVARVAGDEDRPLLQSGRLSYIDTASAEVRPGCPNPAAARGVVDAIDAATRACLAKDLDALVTGPLSKEVLASAGYPYPGHTELLAEICACKQPIMLLTGRGLHVVPATIHCALREVPERLRELDLTGLLTSVSKEFGSSFGLEHPRIAVCGLNPHASDGGRFGDEEAILIAPAIERARKAGASVFGPLSADSVFSRCLAGEFDVVVGMYHDQVLGPLKLHSFGEAVNVTLGLPIVRTSVDHGTAFDRAGRGEANAGSLRAAIRLAIDLVERRRRAPSDGASSCPERPVE